jgi:F420-dependent oxidoreductase-like protein
VTAVRLGLGLKGINPGKPLASSYVELVKAAERCGYESVWAGEFQATDPFPLLAWLGGQTSHIGLGCGIAQVTGRTPVTMAAGAVTLDAMSGGRFRLGLGVSGPRVVEGWHGQPYDRPLSYLRDYLAVVRLALNGEPIRYSGPRITLPLASSPVAPPLPLPASPRAVPVYLAALGRGAVTLAGELADGWIAIHCPPGYLARGQDWLREGAARGGRSLDGFTTSVVVNCCVDDDELARDLVRPMLALFLGGMGTSEVNFYNRLAARLGFGPAADAVAKAFAAGGIAEAIGMIDDDIVDEMSLCGTADQVRARLAAYQEAGVDTVIVNLPAMPLPAQIEQVELISTLKPSPTPPTSAREKGMLR